MSFDAEIPDLLADLGAEIVGAQIILDDPEALNDPRVVAKIKQVIAAFKANPLLRYFPHEKQHAYHAWRRQIKVLIGGERSGKTLGGNADDIIQAVPAELVPPHLLPFKIFEPPFYGRVITPDYGQSYAEILRSLEEWIPAEALHLGKWDAAFSDKKHVLNFADGGFLEFMTQMQEVSQFGGTSRHRVRYDEEPKGIKGEAIREANVNRLIQYRGDECFNFSPVNGLGATGENLWDERGEEVAKEVWVSPRTVIVRAKQADNPHLDVEGKREAEEKIPVRMRAARQEGQLVHGAGLVYEEFDRDLHVCPPVSPEFVKSLEQIDCLDPGLNTGFLFSGFDSDDVLWFWSELFRTDSDSVPDKVVAKIFDRRSEWDLPRRPRKTYIDPAAGARHHTLGRDRKVEDLYIDEGLRLRQADHDVDAGVYEVKRRLANIDKDGNPAPLIQISEECKHLIWELGRYRKERNASGDLQIVKENDHLCDCARYIAMHRRKKKPKRRRNADRTYVPGTAPPINSYPDTRPVPPMGKFS